MQTEKKSSLCVFACTCMADYSILHERMCYLLYKKNYGFLSPIRYYNNQHITVMCYMSVKNWHKHSRGDMCDLDFVHTCAKLKTQ